MFYVWQRNDGYIHASCYPVKGWTTSKGEEISFVHLGSFENWSDAAKLIENARKQLIGE